MSYGGLTFEQFSLLRDIVSSGANGYQLSKRDPRANDLARRGFIRCRRSDNNSETWWVTAEGRQQVST